MGVKKIAIELNQAKNKYVVWLKKNKAEDIDIYEGDEDDSSDWDYYRCITAFIDNRLYTVYFEMWNSEIKIRYSDDDNRYNNLNIQEFLQLID